MVHKQKARHVHVVRLDESGLAHAKHLEEKWFGARAWISAHFGQ